MKTYQTIALRLSYDRDKTVAPSRNGRTVLFVSEGGPIPVEAEAVAMHLYDEIKLEDARVMLGFQPEDIYAYACSCYFDHMAKALYTFELFGSHAIGTGQSCNLVHGPMMESVLIEHFLNTGEVGLGCIESFEIPARHQWDKAYSELERIDNKQYGLMWE